MTKPTPGKIVRQPKAPPTTPKAPKLPHLSVVSAKAELCRRSLAFFVQEFWDVIVEDELEWAPHMNVLCNEIQYVYELTFMRFDEDGKKLGRRAKEHDLIINIPPGTTKSTIATVMAPVWGWINDPSLRVLSASYSGRLSTAHATLSRDIIRSPKFRLYFPDVKIKADEDGKLDYKTTAKGQRFATSVGGSATGVHAHIITIDDPHNPKEAASLTQVQKANTWADATLSTRKVDKRVTVTILIMQRLASEDLTGHFLGKKRLKKGYRHVCLPATLSKLVKPLEYRQIYRDGMLDPVRLNQDVLDEAQIDLGSNGFAGQFDQSPVPAGGGIWKRFFVSVPDSVFPHRSMLTSLGSDWDLAYTKDDENSASAYVTAGKLEGRIYIDDLGWDWLEYPDLIKWMKSRIGPHYIEAKASGKSAKQSLSNEGITAVEVSVMGGQDKIARAKMSTPVAEAGQVYVRESLLDRLYNDSKQGILLFPLAAHTDLADALAQSLQRLDNRAEIKIANEKELNEDDPVDW